MLMRSRRFLFITDYLELVPGSELFGSDAPQSHKGTGEMALIMKTQFESNIGQ